MVLTHAMMRLAELTTSIDPAVSFELRMVAGMLVVLAQDYDECASSRVEEIAVLTDLLCRGAELSEGRFAWSSTSTGEMPDDLRISALDARLDSLGRALVDLQAWLETEPGKPAASLLKEVFEAEYAGAKRRALMVSHW